MALTESGIEVVQATDEMTEAMLGNSAEMKAKKRRALETASVQEEHQPTVVSSADGAKVLNNLDNVATEYEEKSNQPKTLPQIGIDFNKGRQAKAEWKQAVAKAADNVAFWDAVSGIINQQSAEQTTQEAQPIAQQETTIEETQQEQSSQETADSEPQPIGRGVFGDIYDQFCGKAKEAIAFLLGKKDGEAIGALHHREIGDIDLVWGTEGTGHSDGFGLAKLVKYHPEVLDNLQEILDDMHVTSRTVNRIQLESETHRASVRLTWDNQSKTWLLTAFEKRETSEPTSSSSDVAGTQNESLDDTATQQSSDVSDIEVSENISEKQAAEEKTSQENISPEEQLATEATIKALTDIGIEVVEATDEMAMAVLGNSAEMMAKKRRALETVSVQETEHQQTAISSADGAKVVNNLDNVATEYEEKSNQPKTLPQIDIDFNKGRQAKAEWKQAVAKAADNVAFWDAVSGIINQQSAEQTTQEAQPRFSRFLVWINITNV